MNLTRTVAAPSDWHSRFPQEAAHASALECRPPDEEVIVRLVFRALRGVPSKKRQVPGTRCSSLTFQMALQITPRARKPNTIEYTFGGTNLVAIEEHLDDDQLR